MRTSRGVYTRGGCVAPRGVYSAGCTDAQARRYEQTLVGVCSTPRRETPPLRRETRVDFYWLWARASRGAPFSGEGATRLQRVSILRYPLRESRKHPPMLQGVNTGGMGVLQGCKQQVLDSNRGREDDRVTRC